MSGALLVQALRNPGMVEGLNAQSWTALLAAARAEQLIGTLAWRVDGLAMPQAARDVLADARAAVEQGRLAALWEAEMARRALADSGMPVVLLKGTAFVAAGLSAGVGRQIGDLDILVPHERIEEAENALIAAGWEWVKPDPYDDEYYRRWMHELPPLIHRTRDRMIDVHHTILPLTARVRPDADVLIERSVALGNGLQILSPQDIVIHAAAHLIADGDLQGGLRNLWDIDRLCREFAEEREGFYASLYEESARHGLLDAVARALRLSQQIFETPLDEGHVHIGVDQRARRSDALFRRRLLARDGWGQQTRKLTELGFYLRGHWLRMPPFMLVRHLWTKWRKGYSPG